MRQVNGESEDCGTDRTANCCRTAPQPRPGIVTDIAGYAIKNFGTIWTFIRTKSRGLLQCLRNNSELLLAITIVALFVVGILQWSTFENSDQTLKETLATTKAFNRAFVFTHGVKEQQVLRDNNNAAWVFLAELENNGNTKTVDAFVEVACSEPLIKG